MRLGRAYGCGAALAIAEIGAQLDRSILILTDSVAEAESLFSELEFFLDDRRPLALFPDLEVLPYDAFSPHQDISSNRLKVLRQLSGKETSTVLAAASTLLPIWKPLLMGSFISATIIASLIYVAVSVTWRLIVAYRYKRRHLGGRP